MKRFWIVLLSLGLIIAFNTSVFAADAKFNGEFYLQGWYNKNASLIDKDSTAGPGNRGSSAFYTQRLRMGIDIEVAKGLKLGTRFDALERKWMAPRTTAASGSLGIQSTDGEAENIAFEIAYVQFATPIGLFFAGNMPASQFGTPFLDYAAFVNPVIVWMLPQGPWTFALSLKKSQDGQFAPQYGLPTTGIGQGTDNDADAYTLQVQYRWSTGNTGIQLTDVISRKYNVASNPAALNFKTDLPFAILFARNKFGKIFVEDEATFMLGAKYKKYNLPGQTDVKNGIGLTNYFNINVDLSPAKVGFMFIYSKGDDPNTVDKLEGGFHNILDFDRTFNPCLILFNEDYVHWMGNGTGNFGGGSQTGMIAGNAGSKGISTYFDNVWFYQVYGDFNVTPKLNLGASFAYAYADKKPTSDGGTVNSSGSNQFISDKYGSELDVTMKYKIYDNLEYMIGAAYLWTGDYFKGTNTNVKLSNNYLITHKLTLTF